MGPKKSSVVEESEEVKKALELVSLDVADIKIKQDKILKLVEEVARLRALLEDKDKRIEALEKRVEDLEQYSRINDVVVTDLKIKPRSYAHALAEGSDLEPGEMEESSAEQQVAAFLASRDIDLDVNCLEACHPLPTKKGAPPVLIMKFLNRKDKVTLLRQGRKLKGPLMVTKKMLMPDSRASQDASSTLSVGQPSASTTATC
ncbi:uncharacterized protein LOC117532287 [Thalassophryne amazonica]|uniref:uncharacterized protein LOC117532287 n=1 Tax=Thalassophryne amazonica TaxID=390379 RepID=UPI001470F09B|nr:uncharacterized protein LOC117532287 [Thalassophryne amazonica]